MILTLYDKEMNRAPKENSKDIIDIFKQTMKEYDISYQQSDTDPTLFDIHIISTSKEVRGLKKFKKRAMYLIKGHNNLDNRLIRIPKRFKTNEMYTNTTVENIMKYI